MINLLKAIIKLVAVFIMVGSAFVAYNTYKTTTGLLNGQNPQQLQESSEAQKNVIDTGRKAMATAVEVSKPVLEKLGIEIEGTYTENTDEITRHIEESTRALNDTTKKLGSQ